MEKKFKGPEIKFEDILEDTGGYGFFQKMFTFVAIVPQVTAAMIILSPVFTGSSRVPLYCHDNLNGQQQQQQQQCEASLNCTIPTDDAIYSSIVQEWDLVCSSSWMVDAITSCQMAGMMSGALISSLISDRFGRQKSFLFVTLGMGILGSFPALAWNPVSYAVSRFLAGLGMGGCFVVLLCHLMETLRPDKRIVCGSISLWPIGEILLALAAYGLPHWRHLTLLTALPIFLIFAFFPFIQESPRWLLTRKRTQEAYAIMCKIAKFNSKPPPSWETMETLQVTVLQEEAQVVRGIQGVKEIVKSKELRLHLSILCWANVTCAVIYYGVSFSAKSLSGSPHLNMLYMGILDIFAKPSILILNNWLGRRRTFFTTMTFASLCLVTVLSLKLSKQVDSEVITVITVFALLGRFGVLASWGSLSCIILESFPTPMRASCLGFAVFTGYLGGIVAPSLPLLDTVLSNSQYIVYTFLAISSAILSWFLRDMTGIPLMDTMNHSKS